MPESEQTSPTSHLEELLQENLEVAKENNKLLKRMHRNAMLGLIAKVVIWLVLLGVPLIILGPYLRPLFTIATQGKATSTPKADSVLGVPSADELQQVIDIYSGKSQ